MKFTEMASLGNVIGFIDNDAETTVVISGHYDHLGYGGEGSMYKVKLKFIMVQMIMQVVFH